MKTARQISAILKARQKADKIQPTKKVVDDIDDDDWRTDEIKMNIEYNTEKQKKQFFIDRDGVIRRFTGDLTREIISMHYRIASDLFPDIVYPKSPDDHVAKVLGWVLCGSTVYTTPICHRRPTAAQIKTLTDLGDWYIKGLCFPYKGSMVSFDKYGPLCDD